MLICVHDSHAKDDELEYAAVQASKPIQYKTSNFGVLDFDRSTNWFIGKCKWNGKSVAIIIEPVDGIDISPQIDVAQSLFTRMNHWTEKICEMAAAQLLSTANDWRQKKAKTIDAAAFKRRIKLHSIFINNSGGFTFRFEDDRMFSGHMIEVSGSIDGGVERCDLVG